MIENNIGKKLKEARIDQKLTQKDLAGDFITRNMLSQIENGIANPSIKTIEYLAKALNKPISYFIDSSYDDNTYNTNDLLKQAFDMYDNRQFDTCASFLVSNKLNSKNSNGGLLYWCCLINLGIEKFLNNSIIDAKNTILEAYSIEPEIKLSDNTLKCKSLLVLCRIYLAIEEPEKASQTYDEYLSLINNSLDIDDSIFVKCEIYLKTGKYDECMKYINNEASLSLQSTGRFNYIKGVIFYNKKQYSEAIQAFENAVEKGISEQNRSIIYKYIADCYSKLNQYDKAYDYLNNIYRKKTQ